MWGRLLPPPTDASAAPRPHPTNLASASSSSCCRRRHASRGQRRLTEEFRLQRRCRRHRRRTRDSGRGRGVHLVLFPCAQADSKRRAGAARAHDRRPLLLLPSCPAHFAAGHVGEFLTRFHFLVASVPGGDLGIERLNLSWCMSTEGEARRRAGVQDLRRRRGYHGRGRRLRRLRRLRLTGEPPLLRVRAHEQHPGVPAVQDQVQVP
jgi:hypothetical protein